MPLNYKDGSGERWTRIDPRLRPATGDSLTTRATAFSLRLPTTLGDGGRVAVSHGRNEVSFTPLTRRSRATTNDSTATYRGAYRAADVSWSATASGVKEIISLRDVTAPRRFVYDLTLSEGLRPVLVPSGQIEVRRGGDQVGVIPAPWMKDAAGVTSSAASYRLKRVAGGWQIVLSLSDEWVGASERKFPIAVDPSYELSQATWCNVPTRPSGVAACAGPLELGGTPIFTSVLRWEHVTDAIPYGSQVLSASMNLNAIGGSGPVEVDVRELSQPFSPESLAGLRGGNGTAPWQDGMDGGLWFALGKRIESKTSVTPVTGSAVPVSLGVSRLVQGWVDGYLDNPASAPWPAGSAFNNRGLLMSLAQPGGSVQFADGSAGVSGPRLSVVWEPRSGDRWSADKRQVRISPTEVIKVNRANGELIVDSRDVSITGPLGPALTFSRVYAGRGDVPSEPGVLGTGWSDNVADPSLRSSGFDQTRNLHWVDGGRYRFDQNLSTGLWEDGYRNRPMSLAKRAAIDPDGSGFTVSPTVTTTPEGQADDNNQYVFDDGSINGLSDDRLKKIVAPGGGAVTYTRLSNGIRATDANGNWIKLHVTADGKVDTVTDNTGKVWRYAYNPNTGRLEQAMAPDGRWSAYYYDSAGRILSISTAPQIGGPASGVSVEYGSDGRVTSLESHGVSGNSGVTFSYPTPYETNEAGSGPSRRTLSWRGSSYVHWDPTAKPKASASGALLNLKDKYTKGDSTVDVTVAADRDAGSYLRSFGLRNTGLGRTLGTTNTTCTVPLPPPYSGVVPSGDNCPNPVSAQYDVNLATLPEGGNTFRAVATNDATLQGQSDPWTVYIDRTGPTSIAASGELWDLKDQYFNGNGTRTVTVAAHDPLLEDDERGSGVQHLALEDVGHGIVAEADVTCDTNTCPVDASKSLSFDAGLLAEGAHQFRVVATDLVGNVSQSDPWTVLVDRSPPPTPSDIQVGNYDPDDPSHVATIDWDTGNDPNLLDGNLGSGVASSRMRYSVNGGALTAWIPAPNNTIDIPGVNQGDQLGVEVQTLDNVGNGSDVGTAILDLSFLTVDGVSDRGEVGDTPAADPVVDHDPTTEVPKGEDLPSLPEPPADLVSVPPPAGSSARAGARHRWKIKVRKDDGTENPNGWVTIRNDKQQLYIGAGKNGWTFDSIKSSKDKPTDTALGLYGYLYGQYKYCGWINSNLLTDPADNPDDHCGSFDHIPVTKFAGLVNCDQCNKGTSVVLDQAVTGYRNIRPWGNGRYKPTNAAIRYQPGDKVGWRYVTPDNKWVAVVDGSIPSNANWAFLPRAAFAYDSRGKSGMCDAGRGSPRPTTKPEHSSWPPVCSIH